MTTLTRPAQLAVLPDPSGLLAAIMANPLEDDPRLRYADWLQEEGEEARAELIRVQVDFVRIGAPPTGSIESHRAWMEKYREQINVERRMFDAFERVAASLGCGGVFDSVNLCFERGFISEVVCPWERWAKGGDALREREWCPKVVLTTWPGEGGQRLINFDDITDNIFKALDRRWPGTTCELTLPT